MEDACGWTALDLEGDGCVDRFLIERFGITKPLDKAGARAHAHSKRGRFMLAWNVSDVEVDGTLRSVSFEDYFSLTKQPSDVQIDDRLAERLTPTSK